MKTLRISSLITLLTFVYLFSGVAFSQKKQLDHTVYDNWKQIENLKISDNGSIIYYEVNPQEGDGVLIFDKSKSGEKIKIDRGYNATITPDENYAVCLIKPLFAATRKAKIKKEKTEKMPKIRWLL